MTTNLAGRRVEGFFRIFIDDDEFSKLQRNEVIGGILKNSLKIFETFGIFSFLAFLIETF